MILFNKEVNLRTHYCKIFNEEEQPVSEPYIALYVKFKGCNASCSFCEYMNDSKKFNEDKFYKVLEQLMSQIKIFKINFTGGEPTLNYDLFKRIVKNTREKLNVNFTLNTNGYNMNKLFEDGTYEYFDSISLSRHHWIDELNEIILKTKAPSTEDIKRYRGAFSDEDKMIFHCACNLIKGYIDNKEDIFRYLEYLSEIGVESTGFSDLMPLNQWCKDHLVNYNILDLVDNKRFFLQKEQKYKDMCQCNNYLYLPEQKGKNLIKVYTKNTFKPMDMNTALVFDGENLKLGYGGPVLI